MIAKYCNDLGIHHTQAPGSRVTDVCTVDAQLCASAVRTSKPPCMEGSAGVPSSSIGPLNAGVNLLLLAEAHCASSGFVPKDTGEEWG